MLVLLEVRLLRLCFLALLATSLVGCDAYVNFQVENALPEVARMEATLKGSPRPAVVRTIVPGRIANEVAWVTGGGQSYSGSMKAFSDAGVLLSERRWLVTRGQDGRLPECRFQIQPGIKPDELAPCLEQLEVPR
jgi:hypothetical protein